MHRDKTIITYLFTYTNMGHMPLTFPMIDTEMKIMELHIESYISSTNITPPHQTYRPIVI